ncbi:hypothetical protein NE634_20525, partial [Lacrimispora saccharolytica]|nr:hypothetical protein [Lacrimispora saccharolytica]
KLLYNGYSTISLGYAGLHEMCVCMTGHSHTAPEGHDFATRTQLPSSTKVLAEPSARTKITTGAP